MLFEQGALGANSGVHAAGQGDAAADVLILA